MTVTLSFDTATTATAVALRRPDGQILEARDDPPPGARPGHATRLLALADGLLREASIDWRELELLAVGLGPGTFTGLRIGVSSARALAQSLNVGVRGVSSLAALAHGALSADATAQRVLAVLDARRGEAFAAASSPTGELSAPRAMAPGQLPSMLETAPHEDWLAVGDGAVRYAEILTAAGARVPAADSPLHLVSARAICELADGAPAAELDQLAPEYCRRPDAEIALEGAA